jgi:hypothetical protein
MYQIEKKKFHLKALTQYTMNQLVAYIVVPLWGKKDASITVNLQLGPNGKKSSTVTCHLKKGDVYIVCYKNHSNQTKCRANSVDSAMHCNMHNLSMESIPGRFQALVILYILPGNEDLQPPQEEHNEEADSRCILYDDKLFILVDNEGDGLSLFYSVSCFLKDLLGQETSLTPEEWVPFINLTNSTTFCKSKAAMSLTQFHCTLCEADVDALMLHDVDPGGNFRGIRNLPTDYTSIVENITNNVLVKMEKTKKENVVKLMNRFISDMINASLTTWPGEIHALVLSKILYIRIVFINNSWNGFQEYYDTDCGFVEGTPGLSDTISRPAPTDQKICYLY